MSGVPLPPTFFATLYTPHLQGAKTSIIIDNYKNFDNNNLH